MAGHSTGAWPPEEITMMGCTELYRSIINEGLGSATKLAVAAVEAVDRWLDY